MIQDTIKYNTVELKAENRLEGIYNLKEEDFNIIQDLIKTLVKKY